MARLAENAEEGSGARHKRSPRLKSKKEKTAAAPVELGIALAA